MELCCLVKRIKDQSVFRNTMWGRGAKGAWRTGRLLVWSCYCYHERTLATALSHNAVTYSTHAHTFAVYLLNVQSNILCNHAEKKLQSIREDVESDIFRCMAPCRQRGGFGYFFIFDSNNFSAELIKARTSIRRPCVPKLVLRAHMEESWLFSFIFVFVFPPRIFMFTSFSYFCASSFCCVASHWSLHEDKLTLLELKRLRSLVIEKQEWALHCEIAHLMLAECTKRTGNCFAL